MEVDDHDNASTDSDPFARQPWKKARAESSCYGGAVANGDDTSIDEESLFTNKSDKPITSGKAKAGKKAKAKAKKKSATPKGTPKAKSSGNSGGTGKSKKS